MIATYKRNLMRKIINERETKIMSGRQEKTVDGRKQRLEIISVIDR